MNSFPGLKVMIHCLLEKRTKRYKYLNNYQERSTSYKSTIENA